VGRHAQPQIRQRILDACTDHALEHGLPGRLEPLAAASGTSARMLIYHFGGRDALLRAVLAQARRRQLDAWGGLLEPRPGEPYAVTLERAWLTMAGPDGRSYLRLFGQSHTSTEQLLWPDFRREATTDWLPLLEEGLRSIGRPELATLVLAVIRGLLMDLDATGETARADGAFRAFLSLVRDPTGHTEPMAYRMNDEQARAFSPRAPAPARWRRCGPTAVRTWPRSGSSSTARTSSS
jgi:AcrR family transcriptional regulator